MNTSSSISSNSAVETVPPAYADDLGRITRAELRNKGEKLVLFDGQGPLFCLECGRGDSWDIDENGTVTVQAWNGTHTLPGLVQMPAS